MGIEFLVILSNVFPLLKGAKIEGVKVRIY